MPDYERELGAWRAFRRERVAGPEGWLAVVGLWWLGEGLTALGSDPGNAIVLPSGPARLGALEIHEGRAEFAFDPAVPGGGQPIELRDDADGHPTVVRVGSLSLSVIRRQGRLGLRVRNAESPARQAFRGLRSFPADPRWRVEARLDPSIHGRSVSLPTVLDTVETYVVAGRLRFELAGEEHALEAYGEPGETDLFVMFGDATNGRETYGGGRYLYARPPGADGLTVVDFNRAYNPPCVFSLHATCALPPPENHLPIRVEAGELAYDHEVRRSDD